MTRIAEREPPVSVPVRTCRSPLAGWPEGVRAHRLAKPRRIPWQHPARPAEKNLPRHEKKHWFLEKVNMVSENH